jgi:hypothetical protein
VLKLKYVMQGGNAVDRVIGAARKHDLIEIGDLIFDLVSYGVCGGGCARPLDAKSTGSGKNFCLNQPAATSSRLAVTHVPGVTW